FVDATAKTAAASGAALESFRAEGEALKATPALPETALAETARTRIAARAESFKALETRLALSIDLAAIEGLALCVLAKDFVGRVDLGEFRRRFLVLLVGVRMQLLGEPTKCGLDRLRACVLRNPQHFIGVAHHRTPMKSPGRRT